MKLTASAEEIKKAFSEVADSSKLELLLEFANELPELPKEYKDRPELLERVEECQSPVFLFVEVNSGQVRIYLTAPAEAPTTRGFASILQGALDKADATDVLSFPETFIDSLGLTKLVSPLRIRGMHGMLFRIKRQVRDKLHGD